MKKITLLLLIISVFALHGIAQKVTNVKATQKDNRVIVNYKVEGGATDRVYIPVLYYSTDGGSNYHKCESTKAKYAKPNQSAQITWNVTSDLDYFEGSNIVFKVKAYSRVLLNGVVYRYIKIGNQMWMAENLNLDVGNGCWCYDNKQANCNKYGRLYTWEAAKRAANKITGWHLPSDAEWKQLERYLGMSKSDADDIGWRGGKVGTKLKSTSGWKDGGNGNNSSGFSALPGGDRYSNDYFDNHGSDTNFWTATAYDSSSAWLHYLDYFHSEGSRYYDSKSYGFSVRLVRD